MILEIIVQIRQFHIVVNSVTLFALLKLKPKLNRAAVLRVIDLSRGSSDLKFKAGAQRRAAHEKNAAKIWITEYKEALNYSLAEKQRGRNGRKEIISMNNSVARRITSPRETRGWRMRKFPSRGKTGAAIGSVVCRVTEKWRKRREKSSRWPREFTDRLKCQRTSIFAKQLDNRRDGATEIFVKFTTF